MSYKKREKGNYNQGKGCKGSRKAKEREHAKKEAGQQVDEQDDSFRYKQYKRTRNKKLSLEYRLKWYEEAIKTTKTVWLKDWFKDRIKKIKEKLEKLSKK